jgi:nitrate reductase gamma subunit
MAEVSPAQVFWNVVPYVVIAIAVVGTWWRYRYDQFGWTTRSSQLYESRLLQIGSPMFHFGALVVIFGHVAGLFVPASWTDALGMSNHLYHLQAMIFGIPAGLATLAGTGLLIYRRWTRAAVSKATTVNDKLMYVVLVCALVAGMTCTLMGATPSGEAHDYRQNVSVWFRSIWILNPRGDLMAHAATYYQIHVMIALVLFALWPFTRLVHAFSAPVGYLFRPYIVYRSRDAAASDQPVGSVPRRRGW